MAELDDIRRWFAEELRFVAPAYSAAVIEAFATVPRERFLGPGPWRVKGGAVMRDYRTTDDADPRRIYHNVVVALDEARELNNGLPSLWAFLFDSLDLAPGERVLHLGCGTGYYTAVLAEMVGARGEVVAVELDSGLAARARDALAPWPHAKVVSADGASFVSGQVDVIVASAGATHPLPLWLDTLNRGGRLLFPLTCDRYGGAMVLLSRRSDEAFAARFLCPAAFFRFAGARDQEANRRLQAAFEGGDWKNVKSLRRDPHEREEACWLHGEGYCLSRRELAGAAG